MTKVSWTPTETITRRLFFSKFTREIFYQIFILSSSRNSRHSMCLKLFSMSSGKIKVSLANYRPRNQWWHHASHFKHISWQAEAKNFNNEWSWCVTVWADFICREMRHRIDTLNSNTKYAGPGDLKKKNISRNWTIRNHQAQVNVRLSSSLFSSLFNDVCRFVFTITDCGMSCLSPTRINSMFNLSPQPICQ